ncbi:hypothetical protein BLNAU_18251 [Blattamonas nauphoetae]|uniref:Uncharacterized protein n=1 Tax=Blattamonas nauphoetae TaxID=2049346 RepID=A0ABQ9X4U5_9EUKA|nr:hypothetical protein BLNAU_18251 [Blattamonas nauphoetae]
MKKMGIASGLAAMNEASEKVKKEEEREMRRRDKRRRAKKPPSTDHHPSLLHSPSTQTPLSPTPLSEYTEQQLNAAEQGRYQRLLEGRWWDGGD